MAPVRRANGIVISATAAAILCAALLPAAAADDGEVTVCLQHHQPGIGGSLTEFGFSAGMSGPHAIVGEPLSVAGSAYIFDHAEGQWVFGQQLTASDGQAGDQFGRRVAIGTQSGWAMASAPPGVYMYGYDGLIWLEQQQIPPPKDAVNFGKSLAISRNVVGKDDVAVVGASIGGKAYVYRYSGSIWIEEEVLVNEPGDSFGWSVATDGERIFVGAVGDSETCHPEMPNCLAGAIFVFAFDADEQQWIETHKILPPLNPGGWSVAAWLGRAIAIDGDRLIAGSKEKNISSWGVSTDCTHPQCGHAFIYRYEADTDEWVVEGLLGPNHPDARFFGEAVAIEGDTAVIGAWNSSVVGSSSGSAHVFRRNAEGEWIETEMLTPFQTVGANDFGHSVGLSQGRAVIGANFENLQAGAAYFYNVNAEPGDLTCDGAVGVPDLLMLLAEWGDCDDDPADCPADINGDGTVNVDDLLILLANWG